MAKTVQISLTGMTTPVSVWVTDSCTSGVTSQYIANTSSSGYSFSLPSTYEGYTNFGINVIDSDGCQFCQTLTN